MKHSMKQKRPFILIAALLFPGIASAQSAGRFSTLTTNSNILSTGTFGTSPATTTSGAGTRLMWYPRKAAFRAGRVDGTQWNDISIGNYSTAFGWNSIASGAQSTAFGNAATASGDSSTATGIGTKAAAMGVTALGRFNTGLGSATSWVATDPLFEIGNGTSATSLSNAFTVFKNGNATLFGSLTAGSITSAGSPVITAATSDSILTGQGFFKLGASNSALFPGQATFQNGLTLSSGSLNVSSTTASTSSTTGALTVAGGLGVSGNSFLGGNATVAGSITSGGSAVITVATSNSLLTSQGFFKLGSGNTALFPGEATFQNGLTLSAGNLAVSSTTPSTSSTTGALTVAGGLGVSGNTNINGSLTTIGETKLQALRVSGQVILEAPQGDISMGEYQ